MVIDTTVSLNTIINAIVGGVVTAIGWGLRHIFRDVRAFIVRIQSFDTRIEDTAEVVDAHSEVLIRTGWARGSKFKTVSQQRRSGDSAEKEPLF